MVSIVTVEPPTCAATLPDGITWCRGWDNVRGPTNVPHGPATPWLPQHLRHLDPIWCETGIGPEIGLPNKPYGPLDFSGRTDYAHRMMTQTCTAYHSPAQALTG